MADMKLRLLAVLALALPAAAHAAVVLDERTEHYAINGASAADLRREMSANGPAGAGGRRFDGHTRWNVSWRYWYRQGGGRCAIERVETSVKVAVVMPKWDDGRAPADLRARWQRYYAALLEHEMGHRRHGVDAGNEIDRAIAALPPQSNCDALGARANAAGNDVIRKYNQRDLDYDSTTNHGATQGARFP